MKNQNRQDAGEQGGEPIRVGPYWVTCGKCGDEYETSSIHVCQSPPATAETEEIATEIARRIYEVVPELKIRSDVNIALEVNDVLDRHSAANKAQLVNLRALLNAAEMEIAIKLKALNQIAEQQMEITELKEDVNHLNQMLRDKGYGQGEIDAYVSQCDELAALKEAKDEAFRNLREAHIIQKQRDDREIAELKEENLAGLKMQQESDKLLDAALNKGREIESQLAALREDKERLDYLEARSTQLDWDYEESIRTVDIITGNVNDREWNEAGRGNTIREAIDSARKERKKDG